MSNLIINPYTNTYSRYTHNENELLKSKLSQLYKCDNITIANSGLHANFLTIDIILKSHIVNNIIYINELYHESVNLIKSYESNKNINIICSDLNDDIIINLFKSEQINNKTNILFIESCTNPNGYIFNYEIIPQLRLLSNKLFIICDNSWLSYYIFNPFDFDIDIVTISLTKYYSGGNAICGACLIKDKILFDLLDNHVKISGIHISPLHISIINSKIDLIENRLNITSILTHDVINYLQKIDYDIKINHPNYNQQTIKLAKKYFKNNLYPSTFTFGIKICKDMLLKILNKLNILSIETSFGYKLTILDNYIYVIDNYSFIRISIGYEDNIDRIIMGLNELFDYIMKL